MRKEFSLLGDIVGRSHLGAWEAQMIAAFTGYSRFKPTKDMWPSSTSSSIGSVAYQRLTGKSGSFVLMINTTQRGYEQKE